MLCRDWLYKCSHDRLLNDKRIIIAYEIKRGGCNYLGSYGAKGCINMQKAYHNSLIGKSAYPYNNYQWVVIVSP